MRFAEPKAREERLVFISLFQPTQSFIDDQFAHPTFDFSGGFAVAKKRRGIFAKVAGIREPVIESVIAGVGLFAGIEIARTMPFAGEHCLVACAFEQFGYRRFFLLECEAV